MIKAKVVYVKRSTLFNWEDVASGTSRAEAVDLENLIDDIIDVLDSGNAVFITRAEDYRDE